MDQSTHSWFNKLEGAVNDFKDMYIEKTATIAADLKNALAQQSDLSARVADIERWRDQREGEDKERERASRSRIAKWAVAIVAVEIMVAVAIKLWWK